MIEHEYVLAGTGSRSLRTAPADVRTEAASRVGKLLRDRLAERGAELIVVSGMAEGFDHLLAAKAVDLGIDLWCVIPHRGYGDYYWRRNSVTGRDQSAEFCRLLDSAQRVTYVCDSIYVNGEHSNFVRNRWMVDTADEFAVWNPAFPGTKHCLAAIKRAKLPYVDLSEGLVP